MPLRQQKKANDEILFWQTTCHLWRVVGWESVTKRILQWSSSAHTLKCSLQNESFRRTFRRKMLWKVNASIGLSDCVRNSFCPNFETETTTSLIQTPSNLSFRCNFWRTITFPTYNKSSQLDSCTSKRPNFDSAMLLIITWKFWNRNFW